MGVKTKFVPCGEWLPDQPSYNNPGCDVADNVVPVTTSTYAPMPGFLKSATIPLNGPPLAAFSARDSEGNPGLYAGTASKLYVAVAATAPNFVSASGSRTFTAAEWAFAYMNGSVYAINSVDGLQKVTVAVDAPFTAVGGNAPTGKCLAVVQPGFMVVGNINDVTVGIQPQGLRWSSLGDATATGWPLIGSNEAIANESDWQAVTGDHGNLMGIAPDLPTCAAAVFFETAIFQMNYTGDQYIFAFTPVAKAMGTNAPQSIVQRGQTVYYLGSDGFYAFDGTESLPLSAGRVSKFFFDDCDPNQLTSVSGFADPKTGLIFWAYATSASVNGVPNRMLVYNSIVNRWSYVLGFLGYQPFLGLSLGTTLDNIGSLGYNLDNLPFSLDNTILAGGHTVLAGFDTNYNLGYFSGSGLAWSVETTEIQLSPPKRSRTGYIRPLVEEDVASAGVFARSDLVTPATYGALIPQNPSGICPARAEGLYHRAKIAGAAGSVAKHIIGVEFGYTPAGSR